jgi:Protein of unknown function (DUF3429)
MTPAIPLTPLVLGAAGLIPFFGLAALLLAGWSESLGWTTGATRTALLTYGAVIASFLGGIRWGLAVAQPDKAPVRRDYVLSVVPSLAAWGALALPASWDMRALGALILALGLIDQDLAARGLAPAWFGRLRLGLSLGAGLALLLASLR